MDAYGPGNYNFINNFLIKANFGGQEHLVSFNKDYTNFVSLRKMDFEIVFGHNYITKSIPKIILQTSKEKPDINIINLIKNYCKDWKYDHYIDSEIIDFFIKNPLKEFPNIIEKFYSFTKGQHRADLFRYYYLYLNGGFFLDSDAIFEINIEDIIKNYDAIFVKSFMDQPKHIFNGVIGTFPKNPIIYEALKHAYNTNNEELNKEYHYFCAELLNIMNTLKLPNIKIYQEHNKSEEGYGGSIVLDNNIINKNFENKLISHFWKFKKIPINYLSNSTILSKEFTKIYQTNFWEKGSGSGSYIENTIEYNNFVINFIINNNIKVVTDIGCGDWQSSYLIYEEINNFKQFENIDYLGIDCVDFVIENNKKNYPLFKFESFDILNQLEKIRDSELYIIKDVLQHWKLEYIYKLLDFLFDKKKFKYILITNFAEQTHDNPELNHYLGIGRGLNSQFYPLKKYNAIPLLNYFGGENKHLCLITKLPYFNNKYIDIQKYKTEWNHFNKNEINYFDTNVLSIYQIPNKLFRLGPLSDGGYVIADLSQQIKYDYFISCGISNDIRFEEAFLDKYSDIQCICFDGTISNFPQNKNIMQWIPKNIGHFNNNKITNLKKYIQNYQNIFLKMDIEGSEFNWIDSLEEEEINKFSQIVMEIHWPFDKYRFNMLQKLNKTHYLIHIHGNNYCDRDIPKHLPSGRSYDGTITIQYSEKENIKLPEVFEATYVRKNLFHSNNIQKIKKTFPTFLDAPNNPNANDLQFTL